MGTFYHQFRRPPNTPAVSTSAHKGYPISNNQVHHTLSQPLSTLLQKSSPTGTLIYIFTVYGPSASNPVKKASPERIMQKTTGQRGSVQKCPVTNTKYIGKCPQLQACKHLLSCGQGLEGNKEKSDSSWGGSIGREDRIFACFTSCHKDAMSVGLWAKVGFSADTKEGEGERGREKYKQVSTELPSVLKSTFQQPLLDPALPLLLRNEERPQKPGRVPQCSQSWLQVEDLSFLANAITTIPGRRLPLRGASPPQKLSRPHNSLSRSLMEQGRAPTPTPTATARAQSSLCQSSSKKDHNWGTLKYGRNEPIHETENRIADLGTDSWLPR